MKARYTIGKRSGEVSVDRAESELRVHRDGKFRTLQLERKEHEIILSVQGKFWNVSLGSKNRDQVELFLNGEAYLFSWTNRRNAEFLNEGSSGKKLHEIRAVMPGRVARIFVKPGDSVSMNQPLLVLEAMKMENEIQSPRTGTIQSVEVREGSSVETNGLLLRFESDGGHA